MLAVYSSRVYSEFIATLLETVLILLLRMLLSFEFSNNEAHIKLKDLLGSGVSCLRTTKQLQHDFFDSVHVLITFICRGIKISESHIMLSEITGSTYVRHGWN